MQFYAAGTTQASTKAGYGGIVYAYTKQSVLLWKPKSTIIVNIGGMWGNSSKSQQDNMAGVRIEVNHLKEQSIQLSSRIEKSEHNTFLFTCEFELIFS